MPYLSNNGRLVLKIRGHDADDMNVTPFPALHTSANIDADDHLAAARQLADDAEAWLAELDALLGDGSADTASR